MKKTRKRIAVGLTGAAALTGLGVGMLFGPGAALADSSSTSAPTTAAVVAQQAASSGSTQATTATTAPSQNTNPPPRPPADGVNRPNDVAIAAQTIGISEADLRTALQGGQSIAAVAKAHNVDEQKVIDAISAADTKAIDQAVTDGKLTQAQADQMKSNLPAHVKDEVERTGMPGGPGRGGPGRAGPGGPADGVNRPNDVAIAAQTIGISEADLRTALQGGQSIAAVAKAHNVDEQKVIDAISAADTKAIDQAVTDGKLTQAQADQMKSNLPAHVKDEVERTGMPGGPGGPGGPRGGHPGFGGPDGPPPAGAPSGSSSSTTPTTSA